MKKLIFLVPVVILAFTACGGNDEKQTIPSNAEDEQKNESVRGETEAKALASGDYKICDAILDESQRASCKFNIIANIVEQNGDTSLCDEIGLEPFIKTCKTKTPN